MIDLHTHILPKMDDGSASVEESIKILTQMRKTGITTVVATPHFDMRREGINSFLERREESYQTMMEAVGDREVPAVLLGAEVLYCGVGLSRIDEIEKLCIGEGRCMLIESLTHRWNEKFSFEMLKLMAEQNIVPILAHVERYVRHRKNRRILEILQRDGALAQVNADFFLSKETRRKAFKLLQEKKVQVLGSDCHGIEVRRANLPEAMELIQEKFGETLVQKLTARAEWILSAETV